MTANRDEATPGVPVLTTADGRHVFHDGTGRFSLTWTDTFDRMAASRCDEAAALRCAGRATACVGLTVAAGAAPPPAEGGDG